MEATGYFNFSEKAKKFVNVFFLNRFLDPALIGSLDPDSEYGMESRQVKMYPKKEKRKG
jgi:hypothetical protein